MCGVRSGCARGAGDVRRRFGECGGGGGGLCGVCTRGLPPPQNCGRNGFVPTSPTAPTVANSSPPPQPRVQRTMNTCCE